VTISLRVRLARLIRYKKQSIIDQYYAKTSVCVWICRAIGGQHSGHVKVGDVTSVDRLEVLALANGGAVDAPFRQKAGLYS
jgi:hypothetical protein